jgi:ABC-type spermidine/putrescine transport system permease subunit I
MAYLIYQEQLLLANWQQGSALAVLLLLATLSVVFILGRVGNSRNSDLGIR